MTVRQRDRQIDSPTVQPFVDQALFCSAIRDSQQPPSPIGFQSLKLPSPPCAVLLVHIAIYTNTHIYIYEYREYHKIYNVAYNLEWKVMEDLDKWQIFIVGFLMMALGKL